MFYSTHIHAIFAKHLASESQEDKAKDCQRENSEG